MEALLGGFAVTLTLDNLLYCFVGVFQYDTVFGQQPPGLVDRGRSGLNKPPPDPVDGLDIGLFL